MSVIQSIYVALFGRPADPGGLAYWTQVTNNGADLSIMLDTLPNLPEYQARFAGLTNEQIVQSIYTQLFGRDAEPEGLAYFTEQLASGAKNLGNIAVTILQSAQGTDAQEIEAKVSAADLFTASLDTPEEIAAYNGADAAAAAKKFLDAVNKDNPATQESVDAAVEHVVTGEEPGGGQVPNEPGPVDPGPPAPTPLELAQAKAAELHAAWAQLDSDYVFIASQVVDGLPNIGNLALFNNPITIDGQSYTGYQIPTELVGSRHGDTFGQAALNLNKAIVELGLQYADLIAVFPQVALTHETAKEGDGRLQSVHDNILGSISDTSDGLQIRKFDDDTYEAFVERINAIDTDLGARPVYNGYATTDNADYDAVRAFDWERGIERKDSWTDKLIGTVDEDGIGENGHLFFGRTNVVDNFSIIRHEGAGVEVALKVKVRGGEDYIPEVQDGIVVYEVEGGPGSPASWGSPAHWSFDYSIVAGLNGSKIELGDIDFILSIDVNPGEGVNMLEFTLNKDSNPHWVSGLKTLGNDSEVMPNTNVEQNSFNIGFNDLIAAIKEIDENYSFGAGQFEIEISAFHNGVELLTNAIQVNVGDFSPYL